MTNKGFLAYIGYYIKEVNWDNVLKGYIGRVSNGPHHMCPKGPQHHHAGKLYLISCSRTIPTKSGHDADVS